VAASPSEMCPNHRSPHSRWAVALTVTVIVLTASGTTPQWIAIAIELWASGLLHRD
jgi:hypothetical protein